MRSLTSFNLTQIDKLQVGYVHLVKIIFGDSDLILYLCDGQIGSAPTEYHFNSQLYEPFVLSIGDVECGRIHPATWETEQAQTSLLIENQSPIGGFDRFSDIFDTYQAHYAPITIQRLYSGATSASDAVTIFEGLIEDVDMTVEGCNLQCSGIEIGLTDKFKHTVITYDDFPSADPDIVGRILPQAWGRPKRLPFLPIDAGIADKLRIAINASVTSIPVTEIDRWPSTGTIQIGEEQITYTGKNTSTYYLTGATRGANSTTAAEHYYGDTVHQIQTEYIFAIDHPIKSFDNVYVDDILQDSGDYTAYTGQSGDEHATYTGRAVIAFDTLPVLEKQTNLGINDTTAYTIDTTSIELYPDTGESEAYDGNELSYYSQAESTTKTWTFPSDDYGTISKQWFWIRIAATGSIEIRKSDDSTLLATLTNPVEGWYRTSSTDTDWDTGISTVCGVGESASIYEIKKIVEYTATATKSGAVTLTGNSSADIVIGNLVSADIQGFKGSDGDVIERPDQIVKHILVDRCGLTSSANIHYAAYTSAGSFYSSAGYVLSPVLLEKPEARKFINEIAKQAKSLETWEAGRHKLIPIQAVEYGDEDYTVDQWHTDQAGQVVIYTERAYIRNDFSATYNPKWGNAEQDIVRKEKTTSQGTYGVLVDDVYDFGFVQAESQAQAVLDQIADELDESRLVVKVQGSDYLMPIERGDVIKFNVTYPVTNYLAEEFLKKVGKYDLFRVIDKRILPDAIQLEAVFLVAGSLQDYENIQLDDCEPGEFLAQDGAGDLYCYKSTDSVAQGVSGCNGTTCAGNEYCCIKNGVSQCVSSLDECDPYSDDAGAPVAAANSPSKYQACVTDYVGPGASEEQLVDRFTAALALGGSCDCDSLCAAEFERYETTQGFDNGSMVPIGDQIVEDLGYAPGSSDWQQEYIAYKDDAINKCLCECNGNEALEWDSGNAETIARSNNTTITINGGIGPYTWEISGTGLTLSDASTVTGSNTLSASGAACGTATINCTDSCGQEVTGYVRCTTGQWVQKKYWNYGTGDADALVLGGKDGTIVVVGEYQKIQDNKKQRQVVNNSGWGICCDGNPANDVPYCNQGIVPDSLCAPCGWPRVCTGGFPQDSCFYNNYLIYYEWEC